MRNHISHFLLELEEKLQVGVDVANQRTMQDTHSVSTKLREGKTHHQVIKSIETFIGKSNRNRIKYCGTKRFPSLRISNSNVSYGLLWAEKMADTLAAVLHAEINKG